MAKMLYYQVHFWLSILSLGQVSKVISQWKEVTSMLTGKRNGDFVQCGKILSYLKFS